MYQLTICLVSGIAFVWCHKCADYELAQKWAETWVIHPFVELVTVEYVT